MTTGEKLSLIINLIVVVGTVIASYILVRERIVKLETKVDAQEKIQNKLREDHDNLNDNIKKDLSDIRDITTETKTIVQILAKKAAL